jgi:hypothetical protein
MRMPEKLLGLSTTFLPHLSVAAQSREPWRRRVRNLGVADAREWRRRRCPRASEVGIAAAGAGLTVVGQRPRRVQPGVIANASDEHPLSELA